MEHDPCNTGYDGNRLCQKACWCDGDCRAQECDVDAKRLGKHLGGICSLNRCVLFQDTVGHRMSMLRGRQPSHFCGYLVRRRGGAWGPRRRRGVWGVGRREASS